jgi:hypothetical protein
MIEPIHCNVILSLWLCRALDMATFGRWLQISGLVALPLSIILQLQSSITTGQMLQICIVAVCLFCIGRIVEGYARR